MRKHSLFVSFAALMMLSVSCGDDSAPTTGAHADGACVDKSDCASDMECVQGECKSDKAGSEDGKDGDDKNPDDSGKDPGGHGQQDDAPNDQPSDSKLADADGDGIPDRFDRCDVDTDGDGLMDCEDSDSDGDTIPDSIEAGKVTSSGRPMDSDGDLIYDFLSSDSDSNGIPDALECRWGRNTKDFDVATEGCADTDGDGIFDFADNDNDGDGLLDSYEIAGARSAKTPEGKAGADCNNDKQFDDLGTPEAPFTCRGVVAFMNPDSDDDTIPDKIESIADSNDDGYVDVYSLDSDGDTIPDSEERCASGETCTLDSPVVQIEMVYAFQSSDADGDGLSDNKEVYCANLGKHSRESADADGDGYSDASEAAVAEAMGWPIETLLCNPDKGVKDVFDFYFVLPYKGDQDSDKLEFKPAVSKLDVMFNMDVTASMGEEVRAIQNKIGSYLIPEIRKRVSDSAFGVSAFADFPVSSYGSLAEELCYFDSEGSKMCYTDSTHMALRPCTCGWVESDMPWWLYSSPQTDSVKVQNAVNKYSIHNGNDLPESAYEALWMIAKGDDKTLETAAFKVDGRWQYLDHVTNSSGRWGGAGFRTDTLPVVIHITDTYAHDAAATLTYTDGSERSLGYSSDYVKNQHTSSNVHDAYRKAGIRVLSIMRDELDGERQTQLVRTSNETNAIVPVCAFKKADGSWKCGKERCCLTPNKSGEEPDAGNQCVLSYGILSASTMNETIVDGVDALVKYGTYEVSTRIRGFEIPGKSYGTECFIKKVEAFEYIAPENEPEKSCNPVAVPYAVDLKKGYKDGFSNFAPGTSTVGKEGAKLVFNVVAENDSCVEPKDSAQVFYAEIDVINPTTGLLFGTRKVSIIVPAGSNETVVY